MVLQMAPTSYLGSTSFFTCASSPASSSALTNSHSSENGMRLPLRKLAENFLPLRFDFVAISGIDGMNFGKLIAPGKRPARVDDRSRVGEVAGRALFRREAWIDRTAPAVAGNFDATLRIAAGGYRPEDVGHVGRIDIVVDEHDEAAKVAALARAQRDVRRLAGVAAVALFDRDHLKKTHAPLGQPHAFNIGDARLLDFIP